MAKPEEEVTLNAYRSEIEGRTFSVIDNATNEKVDLKIDNQEVKGQRATYDVKPTSSTTYISATMLAVLSRRETWDTLLGLVKTVTKKELSVTSFNPVFDFLETPQGRILKAITIVFVVMFVVLDMIDHAKKKGMIADKGAGYLAGAVIGGAGGFGLAGALVIAGPFGWAIGGLILGVGAVGGMIGGAIAGNA
ncbi:hypothetical protein M427DRAFT_54439 [Gonapodya prolifera JEL478]|uniref:Uncharacterized protein n=1 Tax=Gonapodya prolifera (strain JEL478) TaxID=1344416 RepID=A0A139AM09_GONPJ|nr:hypothetical protein M427DRAFT_54439 [Gonapodya prolifera JEL478]|eukprot:KXS17495.1 hypothetical protein M427DRAFT_54439 [Gonapodya prolifera JEL478]